MRPRVVIFDPHPGVATVVRTAFRLAGYDALSVTTPQAALETVRAYQPDAIVLEWSMRNGTCAGLSSQLRAAVSTRPVVIVAVSVLDEPPGFCEAEGFDDYFVKPIAVAELDVRIRELLPTTSDRA